MYDITNHQRNKSHSLFLHLSQWLVSKRQKITSVDEVVEKRELLLEMYVGIALMESSVGFPQKLKIGQPYDPWFHMCEI